MTSCDCEGRLGIVADGIPTGPGTGNTRRIILLVLLGGLGIACSSSKTSSDGGRRSNASFSAPCVTGTICEYSSPLACEAGCSGGNYVGWECIDGTCER
jgi:hypothetical protein